MHHLDNKAREGILFKPIVLITFEYELGEHKEEDDGFLVYKIVSSCEPFNDPSSYVPVSTQPPITQVYFQQSPLSVTCPIPEACSSLDPRTSNVLLLFINVNVRALIPFPIFFK